MPSFNLNQVKTGLKILMDNTPCVIVDADFVKPGKGQAFTKLKVKNLRTGRLNEVTLRANETLEGANVIDQEMQYLYNDGSDWTFMDLETYDQINASKETLGDTTLWLIEEDICMVTLLDGEPIVVTPPNFIIMEIIETDPGMKGDTSGGGNKPATLASGAVVRVPLFVQIGEKVKVDTRTGEYVSRA